MNFKAKIIFLTSGVVMLSIFPLSYIVKEQSQKVITVKTIEVCKNLALNIANFATEELLVNENFESTQNSILRLKEQDVQGLLDAYVVNVEGIYVGHINSTGLGKPVATKELEYIKNLNDLELREEMDDSGNNKLVFTYPIHLNYSGKTLKLGAAVFKFDREGVYAPVKKIQDTAYLVTSVVFIISILISVISAILMIRPVLILSEGSRIIGGGNLDHRINVESHDEIGQLADSFNDMTAKIQDYMENLETKVTERTREVEEERKKSEELLLNILPKSVTEELKLNGYVQSKLYDYATVLFTDFKGFTKVAEKLSPDELIQELDWCFIQFDEFMTENKMEKLKTIGDSYMCAGGIPEVNRTHPVDVCMAGLQMQEVIRTTKEIKIAHEMPYFDMRLGIHTGPLIAGVIGKKKFAFDVWGDAVNTASRMESSGEPGKVNVSRTTYLLTKDFFEFEYRGKIEAKNKAPMGMYFLTRIKPELSSDIDGMMPNPTFKEMYAEIISGERDLFKNLVNPDEENPEIDQKTTDASNTKDNSNGQSKKKKLNDSLHYLESESKEEEMNQFKIIRKANQLANSGFIMEAKDIYKNALNKNPENVLILNNLGYIYYKLNNLGEAQEKFERALEIDRNCSPVIVNMKRLKKKILPTL